MSMIKKSRDHGVNLDAKCPMCGKPINREEYRVINNDFYHVQCYEIKMSKETHGKA